MSAYQKRFLVTIREESVARIPNFQRDERVVKLGKSYKTYVLDATDELKEAQAYVDNYHRRFLGIPKGHIEITDTEAAKSATA